MTSVNSSKIEVDLLHATPAEEENGLLEVDAARRVRKSSRESGNVVIRYIIQPSSNASALAIIEVMLKRSHENISNTINEHMPPELKSDYAVSVVDDWALQMDAGSRAAQLHGGLESATITASLAPEVEGQLEISVTDAQAYVESEAARSAMQSAMATAEGVVRDDVEVAMHLADNQTATGSLLASDRRAAQLATHSTLKTSAVEVWYIVKPSSNVTAGDMVANLENKSNDDMTALINANMPAELRANVTGSATFEVLEADASLSPPQPPPDADENQSTVLVLVTLEANHMESFTKDTEVKQSVHRVVRQFSGNVTAVNVHSFKTASGSNVSDNTTIDVCTVSITLIPDNNTFKAALTLASQFIEVPLERFTEAFNARLLNDSVARYKPQVVATSAAVGLGETAVVSNVTKSSASTTAISLGASLVLLFNAVLMLASM